MAFTLIDEVLPEDPIAIPQQIDWRSVPRKCLPELLCDPLGGGMSGHVEVDTRRCS